MTFASLAGLFNRLGQFSAAFSPTHHAVGAGYAGASLTGNGFNFCQFAFVVGGEHVDSHHRLHPKATHNLNVLKQVSLARAHILRAFGQHLLRQALTGSNLELTRVALKRTHRGYQHRCMRA